MVVVELKNSAVPLDSKSCCCFGFKKRKKRKTADKVSDDPVKHLAAKVLNICIRSWWKPNKTVKWSIVTFSLF